jgi:hypothetical protein
MRVRSVPFIVALCSSFAYVPSALAQSDRPTMEVGGQVTFLRLTESSTTNTGIGGRFSVDLTRWLSVGAEVNYFPSDDFEVTTPDPDPPPPGYQRSQVTYHRRRTEVLGGARMGYRAERWGVFAKVQPGITHLTNRGVDCTGGVCALSLLAVPEYRAEFALDLGGGVEFYPTRRMVARFDVGDTIIQHRSTLAPPCPIGDCTSHNFTTRLGVGFRF